MPIFDDDQKVTPHRYNYWNSLHREQIFKCPTAESITEESELLCSECRDQEFISILRVKLNPLHYLMDT